MPFLQLNMASLIILILWKWIYLCRAEDVTELTLWAGLGQEASLPCPPDPKFPEETPVLILWFKGLRTEAIYSFDSRHEKFPAGEEWSDDVILRSGAEFRSYLTPPTLVLHHVTKKDRDAYICRIDYLKSPSNYVKVNLSVIVPPNPPVVLWKGEEVIGETGPFFEGETIELVCSAKGGFPPPTVTWWMQGRLIKADQKSFKEDDVTLTSATLSLTATRSQHKMPLVCHARANHPDHSLSRPLTTSVTLAVTLPPLSIVISGLGEQVLAGTTLGLTCASAGSFPPAKISWWMNGSRLTHVARAVKDGGNVSTATVTLRPSTSDDGSNLTCRSANPSSSVAVAGGALTETVILNVVYSPIVSLKLGRNVNPSILKEGQDAFYECEIRSNPPPQRIEWFFNSRPIPQRRGVIISGSSLVLQKLKKHQSGTYSCGASNIYGRNISNEIFLDVKYSPACASDSAQRTQGAAMGRTAAVLCHIDSNPSKKVQFSWTRLLPSGREEQISNENVTSEGSTSKLSVTPQSLDDFGQYLCRAENSVGLQEMPCRVILVTAGPPESPGNCSANPSDKTLIITCKEGFHGGFPQKFRLQAWQGNQLVANITSEFPEWSLNTFDTEESLKLKLEALNTRGASQPVHFHLHSPVANQQATTESRDEPNDVSLLAGIVMGILVALLLILLGILLLIHKKTDAFSKKTASIQDGLAGEECDFKVHTLDPHDEMCAHSPNDESIEASYEHPSDSSSESYDCNSQSATALGTHCHPRRDITVTYFPNHHSKSVPNSIASPFPSHQRTKLNITRNHKYRFKSPLYSELNYRSCGETFTEETVSTSSQNGDCDVDDLQDTAVETSVAQRERITSHSSELDRSSEAPYVKECLTRNRMPLRAPLALDEVEEFKSTEDVDRPSTSNGDPRKQPRLSVTRPRFSSQRESTV